MRRLPSPVRDSCTGDADCKGGGRCVSNPAHNAFFCMQDCAEALCPTGYACTIDRTGAQHQCCPASGVCADGAGTPDGGTGSPDAGPVNDPNVPSINPAAAASAASAWSTTTVPPTRSA